MSKKKSFNTIVLETTINDLHLTRLEASVFYRLLGFLLRDDNPVIYTAEKLAEKTLYKRRAIFQALKSLEDKKLITRSGYSYKRRFYKGETLVEICTQVHKVHGTELHTSALGDSLVHWVHSLVHWVHIIKGVITYQNMSEI